jgi:transglutaminase-like putative cysteine protease
MNNNANVISRSLSDLNKLSLIKLVRFVICVMAMLLFQGLAKAACDIQIVSAGPCLADGTYGIPNVGDDYGLKIIFNVIGTPTQPFGITWTIANVSYTSDNSVTGPGYGKNPYIIRSLYLDDLIPWSITIDPNGVSGNTNSFTSTNGSFTPIPPSSVVNLYAPRLVDGSEVCTLSNLPGSGAISYLVDVFGYPTSHGAQSVISVNLPTNSQYLVTAPSGAPVIAIMRTNIPVGGVFQDTISCVAQVNNVRVNPSILRTVTWSNMDMLTTNWTQWLTPDPVCESTDPAIVNFVQQSLPANYQTVLTPYDTARDLHKAVMKALTYNATPPYSDAVGVLETGQAECSGFSALLTACLRNVGIPARPISGDFEGVGYQGHVMVEFHLPGTEWLISDVTGGNGADPTGTYAYYFGYIPYANTFLAMDVGDAHIIPGSFYPPYTNFGIVGTNPRAWWAASATNMSYNAQFFFQGVPSLWPSICTNGYLNLYLSDVTNQGSVVIETSTNFSTWSPVATNPAAGTPLSYSFSTTNLPCGFFRATMLP